MDKINLAIVFKYLPAYRVGILYKMFEFDKKFDITFYAGNKEQEGIKLANWYLLSKKGNLKYAKTWFYKPSLLLWQKGIISQILFSKHDVFIFDGAISHLPNWIFLILCKLTGKKTLLWSHGFKGVDKGIKLKLRLLFFKYLASGNIIYGNTQKKIMIDLGFNPNTLTVIYNSLNTQLQREKLKWLVDKEIHYLKKSWFNNPKNFTIIFIGRLVERKGVLDVVNAIYDLKIDGIHANCLIVGEGNQENALKRLIEKYNLADQIQMLGALYEEDDLVKCFAASDLMFSPGNVGLNCIHSLGYGVPVCTHDNYEFQNPEVESVIDGESGVLFSYENYNDMILKLKEYILSGRSKKESQAACFKMIDNYYNPNNQSECIKSAVAKILLK